MPFKHHDARRHLEVYETIRKYLPDNQLSPAPGAAGTAVPFPTRQQIADALVISERTARTNVSNILGKLGVASRTQAALLAIREGIAPAPSAG